jgi:zinc-ribbon domain
MSIAQSLKKAFSYYTSNKKLTCIMTKIRKQKKEDNDKVRGFLMGLAFGAIVYGFLSLFEKPRCPNCGARIEKNIQECPNCHTPLTWE